MRDKPNKSDYLDKSFDYTKLTKDQIREILFDNNIKDIPPVTSKKDIFIDFYKKNIYDKIDFLKQQVMPNDEGIEYEDKKTTENIDLFRKKSPMNKKLTNQNDKKITNQRDNKLANQNKPLINQSKSPAKNENKLNYSHEIESPFTKKRSTSSKENDSLFLTTDKFIPEKIDNLNYKKIFFFYTLILLLFFNLFYNNFIFYNFFLEFFILIFFFFLQTYFLKKQILKINLQLKKESLRVYDEILLKIKQSAYEGKSVNVNVVKDKYTCDSRVWKIVKRMMNHNKRVLSRKGLVEGKRVDVWEYKF